MSISYEDRACWYELSFDDSYPPAIKLKVHTDFIDNSPVVSDDAWIVTHFREKFQEFDGLKFSGNLRSSTFGFGNSIEKVNEVNEFIEFSIVLPQRGKMECSHCEGTGFDKILTEECYTCEGTGEYDCPDWRTAYAISASLTIFFTIARDPEQDTSCKNLQLITVKTVTNKEQHGGSLGGEYGIHLCDWLRTKSVGAKLFHSVSIFEMVFVMQIAYAYMYGKVPDYRFSASLASEDGWLNVSCPGNACGLNPDHGSVQATGGYEFGCHNTDTPVQQLALISALAALHDLARQEGVGVLK